MSEQVYYIELKNSHKGCEIDLRRVKVRAIYGGKVNGKIPTACCFKKPSDAIALLEHAIEVMKEDTTTQLIEALHHKDD